MELRHLRYFVAVAKHLSFTAAAESLGVAQPPLSQQIRDLEAEIGTALFERTTRRVALTRAGHDFHVQAIGLLERAAEAVEAASVTSLVASGLGIAIIPEYVARLAHADVVYRPLEGPRIRADVFALWSPAKAALVCNFVDLVRDGRKTLADYADHPGLGAVAGAYRTRAPLGSPAVAEQPDAFPSLNFLYPPSFGFAIFPKRI